TDDVIANIVRLRQREYNQVMSAAICPGLGARGLCFFVPRFAVDDAGDGIRGILLHALPDTHYVSARRIYKQTTFFLQLAAGGNLSAERRDDDGIFRLQLIGFFFFWFFFVG